MLKKIIALIVILVASYGGYLQYVKHTDVESVHYHAGFVVYVDGVKQDFTGFQYMNFTPCAEHAHKQSAAEEQIEKAHLHDGVGDVVHVHRPGGTWADLFQNIGYKLPEGKSVVGYVGGEKRDQILKESIQADQSIIIVIGSSDGVDLSNYVSLEHIKQVESQSELCGTDAHDQPSPSPSAISHVCTLDAQLCDDGSAVGRVGPNCDFAPCPSATPSTWKN